MENKSSAKLTRRNYLRYVWRFLVVLLGLTALFGGLYLYRLTREVDRQWAARSWRLPSIVYSDSFLLYPGQQVSPATLQAKLERLGYRETPAAPDRPGRYWRNAIATGEAWDIFLKALDTPWQQQPARRVEIVWQGGADSGAEGLGGWGGSAVGGVGSGRTGAFLRPGTAAA